MLEGRHIALIEDDEIMGGSLHQRLGLEGARVVWLKTLHRALGALRTPHRPFDAVICDIRLPDGTGEELFLKLCAHGTPPPFLFITAQATAEQAVRLLRSGAADYIVKPFEMAEFLARLAQVIAPSAAPGAGPVFGLSPVAQRLEAALALLAAAEGPVLITGEAGTGKRLAARRIHGLSDRAAAPLVERDLSRLDPAGMAERLFGEGGALAEAGEGVLLLEQVAAAPPPVQARLAELAQSRAPGPRLLATGSGTVEEEAALRPDLLYHLGALRLSVPPLRDRPEDAVWLLTRLFEGMNARRARPLRGIGALAEEAVRRHPWPGNGRELRARLLRAMALAEGEMLFPADLFPDAPAGAEDTPFLPLAEAREAAERAQIRAALERTGGNMAEAAKLLQVSRTTLWEKTQKLGL